MINKKSIWFLTLFSLILVLSVYYITIPNDLLLTNVTSSQEDEKDTDADEVVAEVSESTVLVALRVSAEEEYIEEIESLKNILNDKATSIEEKNNAFEQIKNLNSIKVEQEELETKIEAEYDLKSFVKEGFGFRPSLFKLLARTGKMLSDDRFIDGSNVHTESQFEHNKRRYPKSPELWGDPNA